MAAKLLRHIGNPPIPAPRPPEVIVVVNKPQKRPNLCDLVLNYVYDSMIWINVSAFAYVATFLPYNPDVMLCDNKLVFFSFLVLQQVLFLAMAWIWREKDICISCIGFLGLGLNFPITVMFLYPRGGKWVWSLGSEFDPNYVPNCTMHPSPLLSEGIVEALLDERI